MPERGDGDRYLPGLGEVYARNLPPTTHNIQGDRPLAVKRALVTPEDAALSVTRQCALLGLARSSWYYPRTANGRRTWS